MVGHRSAAWFTAAAPRFQVTVGKSRRRIGNGGGADGEGGADETRGGADIGDTIEKGTLRTTAVSVVTDSIWSSLGAAASTAWRRFATRPAAHMAMEPLQGPLLALRLATTVGVGSLSTSPPI